MAERPKCKVCGEDPATDFALIGATKFAFCALHGEGRSLCPVSYIAQVESEEEFERCRKQAKALEFVKRVEQREAWESERVVNRLGAIKDKLVEAVKDIFEDLTARGRKLHFAFTDAFKLAKLQLSNGHETDFSRIAQIALQSSDLRDVSDVYLREVHNTASLIRKIAMQSATFVNLSPEDLLNLAVQRQELMAPKRYYGVPSKKPVLRESDGTGTYPCSPIFAITKEEFPPSVDEPHSPSSPKESSLPECRICRQSLSTGVYASLAGHEDCKTCFECINKCTTTYLKCPLCKMRYPSSVRAYLESRIPGLIKSSKRRKKACLDCPSSHLSHICPSGQGLCVTCCQLSVVRTRQSLCPYCHDTFSAFVYECSLPARDGCVRCSESVAITEVAKAWRSAAGVRYVCKLCEGNWTEEPWFAID